jgi:hypothetical protein
VPALVRILFKIWMTSIVAAWRIDLIKAYPNLFHPPGAGLEKARGYPACGDGWRDLLNSACAKIEAAIGEGDSFTVLQIKERLAVLRFYWRGSLSTKAEAKIVDAVAKAEARAACTCSLCGEEGRLYRADRALTARCALHAKGRPIELTAGLENVHIVRRIVAGQFRGVTCCRYMRTTDTFIDLLPDAPGIEVRGGISSSRLEGAGHG